MSDTYTRAFWYYEDHSKELSEWIPFSDSESQTIENAYHAKQEQVELDLHIIDLNIMIQISKHNEIEQQAIKRIANTRGTGVLRPSRFCAYESLTDRTFENSDNNGNYRGFAWEWYENQCNPHEPELHRVIEKAATGILIEGINYGEINCAKKLASELLNVKDKGKDIITKCCIRLYTQNSFLYRIVNQALLTLYPSHVYEKVVYRSMQLTEEQINQYKHAINDEQAKQWLCFSSTTKCRAVADFFEGNTLFIIQLPINEYTFGADISSYSDFPDEEEVLLPTQICFKVEKVEHDEEKNKHVVYVNMNVLS